jgi:hypothetical protein
MINPLQVFHQVQEGQAPSTWSVLRPTYQFTLPSAAFTGIACGIVSTLFGTLIVAGITAPSLLHREGAGPFGQPLIIVPIALASLLIAFAVTVFLTNLGKKMNDAMLILLPEGIMSCERCSDETKRSFSVLEYTDIAHIALKIASTRYTRLLALDIQYKNGRTEIWRVKGKYLSPERIAQRVIVAHARTTTS